MPDELKNNQVFDAVTKFLEKNSPTKTPLEAGVVQPGKVYDGLGKVEQRQAHAQLVKEMKEEEKRRER